MIKVILGAKGTGKTKTMLDLSDEAVRSEHGSIVFMERGNKLIRDVNRNIRLIDTKGYDVEDFTKFYGFLCGVAAADYDTSHIFIDSIFKIVKSNDMEAFGQFLKDLEKLSESDKIKFTISVSADEKTATDDVRKYM